MRRILATGNAKHRVSLIIDLSYEGFGRTVYRIIVSDMSYDRTFHCNTKNPKQAIIGQLSVLGITLENEVGLDEALLHYREREANNVDVSNHGDRSGYYRIVLDSMDYRILTGDTNDECAIETMGRKAYRWIDR